MSKRRTAAVVAGVVVVGAVGVVTGIWETAANWARLGVKRTFGHSIPAGYVDQSTPSEPEQASDTTPTS